MIAGQITKQEAQKLLDYRDGELFWRHAGSGRRPDRRATIRDNGRARMLLRLGGKTFQAHYVVWNWHHGITEKELRFLDGNAMNLSIGNLYEIEPKIIVTPSSPACPCCQQPVPVPDAAMIAHYCGLTEAESIILGVVWAGGGYPVKTDKILSRMYEDDPDGGPSPAQMYKSLKERMSRMRSKLSGSGIGIISDGYGRGWRLVMGATAHVE